MHATEKFVYIYAVLLVAFLVFAGFSTVAHGQPAPDCRWNDCSGPQVGPGPCFFEREVCPDIGNQAHADLRQNALRIHRGLRFEGLQ